MYKAITDRVIVKLCVCPKSALISLSATTSQNRGRVIDTGPLVSGVDVGDEIIFHTFDELPLPDENLVVVREKSILGIMENENTEE